MLRRRAGVRLSAHESVQPPLPSLPRPLLGDSPPPPRERHGDHHRLLKGAPQFGRAVYQFSTTKADILVEFVQEPDLLKEHTERNPTILDIQAIPEMSEMYVNTETVTYKAQGMLHLEGGWPKDVSARCRQCAQNFLRAASSRARRVCSRAVAPARPVCTRTPASPPPRAAHALGLVLLSGVTGRQPCARDSDMRAHG